MNNTGKLIEFKDVAQNEKDVRRRVFVDGRNDLTVWYDLAGALIGFELTFKGTVARYAGKKFSLNSIDRSEKDNYSPTLRAVSGEVDLQTMADYVANQEGVLGAELLTYIKTVLERILKTGKVS